jgi:hypothetical protein
MLEEKALIDKKDEAVPSEGVKKPRPVVSITLA